MSDKMYPQLPAQPPPQGYQQPPPPGYQPPPPQGYQQPPPHGYPQPQQQGYPNQPPPYAPGYGQQAGYPAQPYQAAAPAPGQVKSMQGVTDCKKSEWFHRLPPRVKPFTRFESSIVLRTVKLEGLYSTMRADPTLDRKSEQIYEESSVQSLPYVVIYKDLLDHQQLTKDLSLSSSFSHKQRLLHFQPFKICLQIDFEKKLQSSFMS